MILYDYWSVIINIEILKISIIQGDIDKKCR